MVRAAMVNKRFGAGLRLVPSLALVLAVFLGGCASFPEREPRPQPDPPPSSAERETTEAEPAEPEAREDIETAAYTPPQREPEALQRDFPRSAGEVSGPAVTSLYRKAEQRAEAGDHASATALLERALRIEPRNPFVWTALAEQHQAAGHHAQADNAASRANGFARGNPFLEARNWRVISAARRDRGDAQGAEMAHERAEQARIRQGSGG